MDIWKSISYQIYSVISWIKCLCLYEWSLFDKLLFWRQLNWPTKFFQFVRIYPRNLENEHGYRLWDETATPPSVIVPKFNHITPTMIELHWLPVKYRVIYKILLLTFKCISGEAPIYLQEMIKWHITRRALSSGSAFLLEIVYTRDSSVINQSTFFSVINLNNLTYGNSCSN